jgi:hypothetical protein
MPNPNEKNVTQKVANPILEQIAIPMEEAIRLGLFPSAFQTIGCGRAEGENTGGHIPANQQEKRNERYR